MIQLWKIDPLKCHNKISDSQIESEEGCYLWHFQRMVVKIPTTTCSEPPKSTISSHTFRRNQDVRARNLGEILPGVHVRAVWQSARGSAERDDSLLPEVAVRGGQAVCILVRHQLPGGVQYVRLQRDPLQPRESAQRGDLRHQKSKSDFASNSNWK